MDHNKKPYEKLMSSLETSKSFKKEANEVSSICDNFPLVVTVTDWIKERPNLSYDFAGNHDTAFDSVPVELVQGQLIDDLLSCYLGFDGKLIKSKPLTSQYSQRAFIVSDEVDIKDREICLKALSLASHYSLVIRFIQNNWQLTSGRVNQALAAAMDNMVLDYMKFVVHLENEMNKKQLSLLLLFYTIQPVSHVMDILAQIVYLIIESKSTGGSTLSILHTMGCNFLSETDDQEMVEHLTAQAAVPFLESVKKWIYEGIIFDPYDEFMIFGSSHFEESRDRFSNEFWAKRYQIRSCFVPNFLENVQDKILDCGKYLNVFQECTSGKGLVYTQEEEILKYSLNRRQYLSAIDKAYKFASSSLLDIIMNEYKIIDRIKSLKRYMLHQQGDFVVQVLDTCENDLLKPVSELIPSRLSALLELAIHIPSTNDDAFRDDIFLSQKPCEVTKKIINVLNFYSEESQWVDHRGFDVFYLDVERIWPVSLILSDDIIIYYQVMFRHLMYCKYIERLLTRVWLWDKAVNLRSLGQSKGYLKAFTLRHKMLFWIQNFEYYMMDEVIEPHWEDFVEKIKKVENIDDLVKHHSKFLKNCIEDCMLTIPQLLNTFKNLLRICESFTEFIFKMRKFHLDAELLPEEEYHFIDIDPSESKKAEKSAQYDSKTFSQCIDEFSKKFDNYFIKLLKEIQEVSPAISEKLINIIERLNFNHFFTKKLDNGKQLSEKNEKELED